MADPAGVHHGEYSSTTSSDATPPNHLRATVPSGQFDGQRDPEKADHYATTTMADSEKKDGLLEDDEDADMDALIEDLESNSGDVIDEETEVEAGGAKPIPEELLQTPTSHGLTDAEVLVRRKKFGSNQMKEEKENLILKFLGYFVGPIQFVMEVSLGVPGCIDRGGLIREPLSS
jgi:H+-transporting ATPase